MSTGSLDFPTLAAFTDIGTTAASSIGTTLTANASTNTKGVYAQLIAATTRDCDYMLVGISNSQSAGRISVDIAVGAAASEQIIVADLVFASSIVLLQQASVLIPYSIPSGTRISARCQSTTGGDKTDLNIVCGSGDLNYRPYSTCDTYGFAAGTTTGAAIDSGGTINTKGSYTQIVAATTRDIKGLFWSLDNGPDTVGSSSSQSFLYDIAVGAAASEQVILPNLRAGSTATGTGVSITPALIGAVPLQIPAGTRLSCRCQSTNNTAATRKFGITVYGLA